MHSHHDASDLIRRQALTLLAVAQNGLTFAHDPFDRRRYTQVRECAEQLMSLIADGELEQLRSAFTVDIGYMTPKVSVRAAIFNSDGELLLVQERADRLWTLPGGWCDVLETPSQAVAKEVREEAGLIVDVDKLVAVLDHDRHRPAQQPAPLFHVYKLFFLCSERGRVPPDLTETSAIDRFALDALPPLSPSVDEAQLRMMHTHWRHPELPTVFD